MPSNTQPKNWTLWKRCAYDVCSKKIISIYAYYNCSVPELSNCMDPGYWEASSFPVSQRILCILWNPEVFYIFHKIKTLVPVLIQVSTVHSIPSCLLKILCNIFFPSTRRSSKLFLPFGLSYKTTYALIFCPIPAIRPGPLIIFDFITKMVFDEEHRIFYLLIQSYHLAFSLLVKNIFLRIMFSNNLGPCSSLSVKDQVSHPIK